MRQADVEKTDDFEIEVTPAMIEAAEPYLFGFSVDRGPTSDEVLERLFQAMWVAYRASDRLSSPASADHA